MSEKQNWTRHEGAWRIPSADGSDYGVLVRCGPPSSPYFWLLCPATATLYLDASDLNGCNDATCLWDDVHAKAAELHYILTDGGVS